MPQTAVLNKVLEAKAIAFDLLIAQARNREYLKLIEDVMVSQYGYKRKFVQTLLRGLDDYFSGRFEIIDNPKQIKEALR